MKTANDYFTFLQKFFTKFYRYFYVKKFDKLHFKQLKNHNISIKKLTKFQKKQVDSIYKGLGKYNYNTHRLVYSVTGVFYPNIVPELLFRTKIELLLNKGEFKYAWDDKSYLDVFLPDVKIPELIFRNINGVFYDKSFNILSKETVIEHLLKLERFVIKKSYDSGMGQGVQMIISERERILDALQLYEKDYVIQKVFVQHPSLAQFNSSSVNVIRYNSILINEKVIPLNASLRIGAKGAFNDASINEKGEGMIVIGIDNNGRLKDKCYYASGVSAVNELSPEFFSGMKIPGYEKMTEAIIQNHKRLGYFGFIGWDFVVDVDGNPVVMEYNLNGAGILYYQYTNGPLFGEYTKEVIEYMNNIK